MYEIPHQLEYKERIVFNLTFGQLAYVLMFFPIAFYFFFKLKAPLAVRIFLTSIPVLLAGGFMFFNLADHIWNWVTWYRNRKLDENKINNFFEIKEIKDNLIITKKKKIAVLKVEPINFSIKPAGEQEAIMLSFQKFLNSLDFPIQLLMTTETLNLEDYLTDLKSRVNENDANVFEEYQSHIRNIIRENSVMNRNFYIVIPEASNLIIQIKICEERLNNLNLKTSRLSNNELINLFNKICDTKGDNFLPKQIDNFVDYSKISNFKDEKEKPTTKE